MSGVLFDRLGLTLERHLDFRLERGNLLAGNIANVDTPGYRSMELKFDRQLQDLLAGHAPPPGGLRGEVEFDPHALPDADGNQVDLDHEMSKLAENQLMYQAVTRAFSKRVALMKYAISEGQG